jgi:hypothetical protein
MLAPLPRKSCWIIAEHAGDTSPDGMQDLLSRVKWDDAAVGADVREFVGEQLGDADAVLVIDETGDLKKGRHTIGVQRQYSGTAGKVENCQLSVHLVYATETAHPMLDTALHLPKSWCWAEGFCGPATGTGHDQIVAGARAQAPLVEISVVESPPVVDAALLAVDAFGTAAVAEQPIRAALIIGPRR